MMSESVRWVEVGPSRYSRVGGNGPDDEDDSPRTAVLRTLGAAIAETDPDHVPSLLFGFADSQWVSPLLAARVAAAPLWKPLTHFQLLPIYFFFILSMTAMIASPAHAVEIEQDLHVTSCVEPINQLVPAGYYPVIFHEPWIPNRDVVGSARYSWSNSDALERLHRSPDDTRLVTSDYFFDEPSLIYDSFITERLKKRQLANPLMYFRTHNFAGRVVNGVNTILDNLSFVTATGERNPLREGHESICYVNATISMCAKRYQNQVTIVVGYFDYFRYMASELIGKFNNLPSQLGRLGGDVLDDTFKLVCETTGVGLVSHDCEGHDIDVEPYISWLYGLFPGFCVTCHIKANAQQAAVFVAFLWSIYSTVVSFAFAFVQRMSDFTVGNLFGLTLTTEFQLQRIRSIWFDPVVGWYAFCVFNAFTVVQAFVSYFMLYRFPRYGLWLCLKRWHRNTSEMIVSPFPIDSFVVPPPGSGPKLRLELRDKNFYVEAAEGVIGASSRKPHISGNATFDDDSVEGSVLYYVSRVPTPSSTCESGETIYVGRPMIGTPEYDDKGVIVSCPDAKVDEKMLKVEFTEQQINHLRERSGIVCECAMPGAPPPEKVTKSSQAPPNLLAFMLPQAGVEEGKVSLNHHSYMTACWFGLQVIRHSMLNPLDDDAPTCLLRGLRRKFNKHLTYCWAPCGTSEPSLAAATNSVTNKDVPFDKNTGLRERREHGDGPRVHMLIAMLLKHRCYSGLVILFSKLEEITDEHLSVCVNRPGLTRKQIKAGRVHIQEFKFWRARMLRLGYDLNDFWVAMDKNGDRMTQKNLGSKCYGTNSDGQGVLTSADSGIILLACDFVPAIPGVPDGRYMWHNDLEAIKGFYSEFGMNQSHVHNQFPSAKDEMSNKCKIYYMADDEEGNSWLHVARGYFQMNYKEFTTGHLFACFINSLPGASGGGVYLDGPPGWHQIGNWNGFMKNAKFEKVNLFTPNEVFCCHLQNGFIKRHGKPFIGRMTFNAVVGGIREIAMNLGKTAFEAVKWPTSSKLPELIAFGHLDQTSKLPSPVGEVNTEKSSSKDDRATIMTASDLSEFDYDRQDADAQADADAYFDQEEDAMGNRFDHDEGVLITTKADWQAAMGRRLDQAGGKAKDQEYDDKVSKLMDQLDIPYHAAVQLAGESAGVLQAVKDLNAVAGFKSMSEEDQQKVMQYVLDKTAEQEVQPARDAAITAALIAIKSFTGPPGLVGESASASPSDFREAASGVVENVLANAEVDSVGHSTKPAPTLEQSAKAPLTSETQLVGENAQAALRKIPKEAQKKAQKKKDKIKIPKSLFQELQRVSSASQDVQTQVLHYLSTVLPETGPQLADQLNKGPKAK